MRLFCISAGQTTPNRWPNPAPFHSCRQFCWRDRAGPLCWAHRGLPGRRDLSWLQWPSGASLAPLPTASPPPAPQTGALEHSRALWGVTLKAARPWERGSERQCHLCDHFTAAWKSPRGQVQGGRGGRLRLSGDRHQEVGGLLLPLKKGTAAAMDWLGTAQSSVPCASVLISASGLLLPTVAPLSPGKTHTDLRLPDRAAAGEPKQRMAR